MSFSRNVIIPVWVGACLITLSAPLVSAQDRSRYRDYRMGDDLQAVAARSGMAPVVRIIPQEPLVLSELEWRPELLRGAAPQIDPVARVVFGFYDDQLFRIVVDYKRDRTEGMTEADMVEAIAETYGSPSRRTERRRPGAEHGVQDVDMVVARWEDDEYSVTLLRVADSAAFRMIVASARLGRLAQNAGARVVRPSVHPARQRPPQGKSDGEIAQSLRGDRKARLANKAAFTP